MKTQNPTHSNHDGDELNQAVGCFVADVFGELEKHGYEITFHPSSDTTTVENNSTCYVTQVSHDKKQMTVFIPAPIKQDQSARIEIDEKKFEDWLTQPTSSHPGISADVKTLASDILAVKKFFNEVFSNVPDRDVLKLHDYNRAERLKKQLYKYHTTENTAGAVAYIVGYHVRHKELDETMIRDSLEFEFDRRIDLWPIPNIFFNDDNQREKWKTRFRFLMDSAMKELNENRGGIETIMKSRMRAMHKEIQRPNIRKKATTKIDVGPNSMPANLQKIIHDMAGEIMLSRNKFKQRLIQETGGSTKYAGGKKAIKENLISTEEKLRVDAFWLEPICRVIFSRPLDGFTRYKVGDVDSLIKEIIESHIQSLRE